MIDMQGKILPKRRSGNCTRHQRGVKSAVKHARYLGLLGQG
jgi:small subunit ribosomal protein S18